MLNNHFKQLSQQVVSLNDKCTELINQEENINNANNNALPYNHFSHSWD